MIVGKEQRRDSLSQFASADPTWDQLSSSLPYLDAAVVREVCGCTRPSAAEDDLILFSAPVTTTSEEQVTCLVMPKGTTVMSPAVHPGAQARV
ncbi:hypothetical protein BD779DRAFT_1674685 [Infundibulicybe gibba]|nr:hypothetical protein BD779DRAFT_1674685 [Infundibulicybe gibba]